MIDYGATEDEILDRLRTGMAPVPVIDTENADVATDAIDDGEFTPYVGIIFGGPVTNVRDRGIVSVRADLMTAYCIVRVAAPDPEVARLLHRKVFNLLTGWSPYNSGEMTPKAGMAYSTGNANARPTRFYREHSFEYPTNTIREVE